MSRCLPAKVSHPQARRSKPRRDGPSIEPRRVFDAIEGELESRVAPQRLQASFRVARDIFITDHDDAYRYCRQQWLVGRQNLLADEEDVALFVFARLGSFCRCPIWTKDAAMSLGSRMQTMRVASGKIVAASSSVCTKFGSFKTSAAGFAPPVMSAT